MDRDPAETVIVPPPVRIRLRLHGIRMGHAGKRLADFGPALNHPDNAASLGTGPVRCSLDVELSGDAAKALGLDASIGREFELTLSPAKD